MSAYISTEEGTDDGVPLYGANARYAHDDDPYETSHVPAAMRRAQASNGSGSCCCFAGPCTVTKSMCLVIVVLAILTFAFIMAFLHERNKDGSVVYRPLVQPECERTSAEGLKGAVSTTNAYATHAGEAILKKGGNAVDAAIAVQFMLAVVQPQSTGVAGGCLVMFYDHTAGDLISLDGREEAPEQYTPGEFCKDPPAACNGTLAERDSPRCNCTKNGLWSYDETISGGHPVGTPGVVHAMTRLFEDHSSGKVSWAEVLRPARDRAQHGFPMYQHLHDKIVANRARLQLFPASAALFLTGAGDTAPAVGAHWSNPDLAAVLSEFMARGPAGTRSWFYGQAGGATGVLAQEIIDAAANAANPFTGKTGKLSHADFLNYTSVYRTPVSSYFAPFNKPDRVELSPGKLSAYASGNLFRINGFGPPSSGGPSIAMMLEMLSYLDYSSLRPGSVEYLQRLLDVQDIVFADRNRYLGDADFVDVDLTGLLNTTYIRQRRIEEMREGVAARSRYSTDQVPSGTPPNSPTAHLFGDAPDNDRHGTTHLVVVDANHNMVSMTTTVEENLGSAVVVPGRGFLLNNELNDFAYSPREMQAPHRLLANRPQGGKRRHRSAVGADANTMGGKRPLSSMSPTIMFRPCDLAHSADPGQIGCWRPYMGAGSPGGSRIIGAVLNTVMNVLAFDMCPGDATAWPRIITRNEGDVRATPGYLNNNATVTALEARGFHLTFDEKKRPKNYVESVQMQWPAWTGGASQGKPLLRATADTTRLDTALAVAF